MTRLHGERGQSTVVVVLFMTVILGMAAAVLDVGSWFRADRAVQQAADAAALAGAHALPGNTSQASSLALSYSDKNGGGVLDADISFSTTQLTNDTISVRARRPAPGFFARLFGVNSVTVDATAKARAGVAGAARWAAPFGVDERHRLISGTSPSTGKTCPCFSEATDLGLQRVGPGAFRVINIDGSQGGTSPPTIASWIQYGYSGYMPIDWYFSDPGARFNSSSIQSALNTRIGKVILLPIYREVIGSGANAEYHVVGFVGFRITGYTINGSRDAYLYGHFETITWDGIMSESGSDRDYGAHVIELID